MVVSDIRLCLWSINERLAGREGIDVDMPDNDPLDDMIEFGLEEARERENDPRFDLDDLEREL